MEREQEQSGELARSLEPEDAKPGDVDPAAGATQPGGDTDHVVEEKGEEG